MSDLEVDRPDEANGALRIRIDAPARRNALTLETVGHLAATLKKSPSETILLGSSTGAAFSAGADLDIDDVSRTRLSDLLYECYELMITRPGIVIAVIQGAAVGGGAQLTAAADLRVISDSARWRWVGPGHGLAVGAWILPALLGRSRGLDLTLTSRWLEADEAVASGFASRIDSDPWEHAYQLADHLRRSSIAALARVKSIATRPSLLELLRMERTENRDSWSGSAPSAQAASEESRRTAGARSQELNRRATDSSQTDSSKIGEGS